MDSVACWCFYIIITLSLVIPTVTSCANFDDKNATCVNGTSTGECLQCWDFRFYGKQCENVCPNTCLNCHCQLISGSVVCIEGCVNGMKGNSCSVDCPTSCTHCERYGDRCVGPCESQLYHGDFCNKTCPEECRNGCNKTTGNCNSCKPGHTGSSCTIICSSGCTYKCDVHTDNCDRCVEGYKGRHCNETCPYNCADGCDRDTGKCGNRKKGYTGTTTKDLALTIAGTVLIVVVVTGSLLLLGVMLWKRRKRAKLSENTGPVPDMNSQKMIRDKIDDKFCDIISSSKCHINPTYGLAKDYELKFVKYCDEIQSEDSQLNVDFIMNEFTKLPPPDSRPSKCGSHEENAHKNRYRDVLPFDETRVFLQIDGGEEHDYINASYINGYRNLVRYVAAQGPSLQVIDDFWRMIWQLNTTKIVMLTNLVEAGKMKCEMYWPFCSSEYQAFGNVCVQCVEEKVYQFYTLRTLAVWKGKAKTRTIRQFHFTAWPDHGVPEETKSIIDFHRVVKDTGPNAFGPMIVHCSAGVGRSGTFIALDYLLDEARYEGSVCIYKCIQEFRFQRMKMVQTKEQYKFVYDVLVSALQYRGTVPLYYSPVLLQCETCWNKKSQAKSPEDEASAEENDQEYQPLWNCGLANRESFLPGSPQPLSDVCAIISEDSPPLLRTPIQMQLEADTEVYKNEMEKQRISWDTAL